MTETRTKIYFAIKTEDQKIDQNTIKDYINLVPTKFELMFERGKVPRCTSWIYETAEFIELDIEPEFNELISILSPYIAGLKKLKNDFDVEYVFQLVIRIGEHTPALHFGNNITRFASEINAEIDCDMYN